jgi:hypothetical protein
MQQVPEGRFIADEAGTSAKLFFDKHALSRLHFGFNSDTAEPAINTLQLIVRN